ncbi:MAG: hypothetical protein J3K34DRAFT_524753 [Monoraphidium minutum]|nr:MAG: hypothetical protein J3K34DRAFT_524753 [Monoraphidium minutum]
MLHQQSCCKRASVWAVVAGAGTGARSARPDGQRPAADEAPDARAPAPALAPAPPPATDALLAPRQRGKRQARVPKGDLDLPGGPQWSALRRHVFAAGSDPGLPTIKALVLVEGDQDQRALAKAVNAPVYVCGGTRVLRSHARQELEALAGLGRPLLVLTDPDERGRELRGHLDSVIGPLIAAAGPPGCLLHAFVPEASAVATADGAVHAAGNRGIEHAVPRVLLAALRGAAPSFPPGRAVWDLQRLQELRLARPFDNGGALAGEDAREGRGHGGEAPRDRRRRLCALLGLGRCSGSQLVAALNRYCDEARVEAALAALDAGAAGGGAPGGGGAAA